MSNMAGVRQETETTERLSLPRLFDGVDVVYLFFFSFMRYVLCRFSLVYCFPEIVGSFEF